jgi:hypothetical protein
MGDRATQRFWQREDNANPAAKVLSDAGFEVRTAMPDVSSRESVRAPDPQWPGHGAS